MKLKNYFKFIKNFVSLTEIDDIFLDINRELDELYQRYRNIRNKGTTYDDLEILGKILEYLLRRVRELQRLAATGTTLSPSLAALILLLLFIITYLLTQGFPLWAKSLLERLHTKLMDIREKFRKVKE